MPIVSSDQYSAMFQHARENGYAIPSINVANIETIQAAIKGAAAKNSPLLIQISMGAAGYAGGGKTPQEVVQGAIALAEFAHRFAAQYNIPVALHTDHAMVKPKDANVPAGADAVEVGLNEIPIVEALVAESEKRVTRGEKPLFNSHMIDAADLPLKQNLELARNLLTRMAKSGIVLELETGSVGGTEEGHTGGIHHTSRDEMIALREALEGVPNGRYIYAATIGNVHGMDGDASAAIQPDILRNNSDVFAEAKGFMGFVFHGGSGVVPEKLHPAIEAGVVKVNYDTTNQKAFAFGVANNLQDKIADVMGGTASKGKIDYRKWLAAGRDSMIESVGDCCDLVKAADKAPEVLEAFKLQGLEAATGELGATRQVG